ncbi:hypothetical protein BAOM_2535 [Peribacillus asahii]|uniref:Uncharacterized protein n=1 Tax=Peribacillus asahii TaxID=228899 RepID=A0A3Q9RMU2_9BACI|nr:hypothetical protein BAOM_2535 [Peribacillus asahii]
MGDICIALIKEIVMRCFMNHRSSSGVKTSRQLQLFGEHHHS